MEKKDYKDTLLIKDTSFEMRGNLPQKDSKFISYWKDINLYHKLSTRQAESFILHDGPPYANGELHVGHSLNKVLKDIVVRKNALEGKQISFILGWDTHGLPIENEIQKKGIKLSEVGREKYLQEAKEFALSKVKSQTLQFEKFALLANLKEVDGLNLESDLNHLKDIYLTLQPKFESKEIEIFHKMFNEGLVYQDLKPVYWSWSSLTALADAEIEYKDLESYSCYVKFKIELIEQSLKDEIFDGIFDTPIFKTPKGLINDINLLIWTTTPWTLPANVAIAFGKDIEYSLIQVEKHGNVDFCIVATNLISKLEEEFKCYGKPGDIVVLKGTKGPKSIDKNLIKKIIENKSFAINPLNNNNSKVVWGHHVTTQAGTGLVHVAGGHGLDDFLIVKENKLPLVVVVDDKGIMQHSKEFDGQFYLKAEPLILEKLGDNVLFHKKFIHSYPIDWRTKKPVIYRATKQWFVNLKKIKDDLLKTIESVSWHPKLGMNRMKSMISNREEWCISRQRLWGVPIPIIYDQNNVPIKNIELQKNIESFISKHGIIGWGEVEIKDLLPKSIPFVHGMRKETDILDVWFDSGSSHLAVLGNKQADVYLEGTDQFRGWFNSSLITSQVINHRAPYKQLISHGFVNDGNGEKMSKSKGNVIDPLKVIEKFGSDVLRLWVASVDYTNDSKISDQIIEQVSNDYRKIRNTLKFLLSNIIDYDNSISKVSTYIDRLILSSVNQTWEDVKKNLNANDFASVTKEILEKISTGTFAYYFDFAKDILYIEKEKSIRRREAQFVLKQIFEVMMYSLGSFIPVTIEEAYQTLDNTKSFFETTSNHLSNVLNHYSIYFEGLKDFLSLRDVVNESLEIKRKEGIIKRSQEAKLDITIPRVYKTLYERIVSQDVKQILLVGEVDLKYLEFCSISNEKEAKIEVLVSKMDGIKCQRCWNTILSKDMFDHDICHRCHNVLK